MKNFIWKSRLARRFVQVFVLLVAAPLVVTIVILGRVGHEQIVWTARTMERINSGTVRDAGKEFQRLGGEAVHQSSAQTAAISIKAIESVSRKMEEIQADSLSATSRDFSNLTKSSFDDAMRQSLATNRGTLGSVSNEMTALFARSARDTQQQAAGHVEKAMLDLKGKMMEEHARRLALMVSEHVANHKNYLVLTSQMPDFHKGNVPGQKAILDALVRRYPMFTMVSVLDETGKETAAAASDRIVTAADMGSYPDAPYFRAALKGDTYIGMEQMPSEDSAPVLRLAVPIEVYQGKVVGVLAASLSLIDLWDTVRNTRIGQHGFAYVLNADRHPLLAARAKAGPLLERSVEVDTLRWHMVVAQPLGEVMQPIHSLESDIIQNTQRALTQMRSDIRDSSQVASARLQRDALTNRDATAKRVQARSEEVFQRLKETTARQTQTELVEMQRATQMQALHTQTESSKQMISAANMASADLSRRIPTLTTYALNRADSRLSIFALLVMVVSCSMGVGVALFIAGRIVRPIILLAQGTRAIAEGDLDERVDEHAPDEIGDLAVAFNTMAASLKKTYAELHETEGQLVQSAKLASLGTLSAGVAHELNQPIAIIRGVSQQLQDEPDLSADVLSDLELIEGQTSRMVKIINHMRTFCRASSYEMTRVNVNQVVQDCFILIGAQLKSHNVSVEFDLCDGAPVVMADANELEQVFLNLITNARDAMEGVNDACITISSRVQEDNFLLEFHDNGTGIPDEVARHIFDPFFTTKEAGKGTGLGLSISHNIIEKHKGTIQVRNDKGAVFTITLPIAGKNVEESTPLQERASTREDLAAAA